MCTSTDNMTNMEAYHYARVEYWLIEATGRRGADRTEALCEMYYHLSEIDDVKARRAARRLLHTHGY